MRFFSPILHRRKLLFVKHGLTTVWLEQQPVVVWRRCHSFVIMHVYSSINKKEKERQMTRISRFLLAIAKPLCFTLLLAWMVFISGGALKWWRPSINQILTLFASYGFSIGLVFWARWRRERYLRESRFPAYLQRKLREHYPHLSAKDCELVERGLHQFFYACSRSGTKFVAMPSKAVDALWHEFILHTSAYKRWCDFALGRFLHHTPSEALGVDLRRNNGLRRAWFYSCKDESIDPKKPTRLPILFALDAKLAIVGGFRYLPDCHGVDKHGSDTHCGTSFGDGNFGGDGGSADFGGADGGGDGCGGGCGGD
jgi:hypothetical protein